MTNTNKKELNTKEKNDSLQSLNKLLFAASQLKKWITDDELKSDMSPGMLMLIESHFSDVAKALDYDSDLAKEQDKRYEDIRKANLQIQELEKKLASSKPIDGLKEQLTELIHNVERWWYTDGVGSVNDAQFTSYGVFEARFNCSIRSMSIFNDCNVEDKIIELKRLGFSFPDSDVDSVYRDHLIDNSENRYLIRSLIKTKFPSATVDSFNSKSCGDSDCFVIWDFKVYVTELSELVSS